MEILLVRHTSTAVPAGICYGVSDVELAAEAAVHIAALLQRMPVVDQVFSSSARRCTTLANSLARQFGLEAQVAPELLELDFGVWEGRPWNAIARREIDVWSRNTWELSPPGGESERLLWGRVEAWFEREISPLRHARIAIVAHAGSLRVLRCLIGRLPHSERWDWSIGLGKCASFRMSP